MSKVFRKLAARANKKATLTQDSVRIAYKTYQFISEGNDSGLTVHALLKAEKNQ